MIILVDFKAEHMKYLLDNGVSDHGLSPFLNFQQAEILEKIGGTYTVLEDDKPVVVGGIFKYWEGRGEAWLLIGKPSIQKFAVIFKMVKRFLADKPFKRIEMVVAHDWKNGNRWAQLLGFKKEADTLKQYMPDGRDVSLYALVRA